MRLSPCVVALVLIIIDYRGAEFIPVWRLRPFLTHLNNLLMVLAFWSTGPAAAKGPGMARVESPPTAAEWRPKSGRPRLCWGERRCWRLIVPVWALCWLGPSGP